MRPMLGTFVEMRVRGLSKDVAVHAIERAFRQIARVERHMSAHDPQSDLGRLFNARGATAVAVHPWTYEVIEAAQKLHFLSSGVFDITIGASLERNSFLPAWRRQSRGRIDGTMGDIELLDRRRLRLRRPMRLDLGGIAKGFAVDRALEALTAAGATSACVNAGGDFRIFGARNDPLWIRDPSAPQRLLCIGTIQTGAVATSSGYIRCRKVASRLLSPYLDPRTGEMLDLRHSVTVIAAACMWADALTKVLALDRQAGAALLDHFEAKAIELRPSEGGVNWNLSQTLPVCNRGSKQGTP